MKYTSLPEATNGNLPETDEGVMRKRLTLSKYGEELYVYIRLTGRETLEYAVGDAIGHIDKNSIETIRL